MDDDKRVAREQAAAMRPLSSVDTLAPGRPFVRHEVLYSGGRVVGGGGAWETSRTAGSPPYEPIPMPAAIRGTYQRNEFNVHPSAVPGHAATATTVLRWRQANGSWYAVNEASGRVEARAMRAADDLWWISVGGGRLDEIDGVYWTDKDAKAACEVGAAWWAEFIRD